MKHYSLLITFVQDYYLYLRLSRNESFIECIQRMCAIYNIDYANLCENFPCIENTSNYIEQAGYLTSGIPSEKEALILSGRV